MVTKPLMNQAILKDYLDSIELHPCRKDEWFLNLKAFLRNHWCLINIE